MEEKRNADAGALVESSSRVSLGCSGCDTGASTSGSVGGCGEGSRGKNGLDVRVSSLDVAYASGGVGGDDPNPSLKIGESSSQDKEFAKLSEPNLVSSKDISDEEQKLDNLSDEKVDFDPNEDDLLSSQELEEFAKDMEEDQTDFQSKIGAMISIPPNDEIFHDGKGKKPLDMPTNIVDGVRKSSRLEKNDDVKVADKAISRAEGKDAFLNKENFGIPSL
ncbi:hypothetical protein ZEAMMB73_Zm00001d052635 [Zea mays]|uniref:Uncharacterized protein n=1 Tax=Zea mays TaxID=4577 RepID=A0A1D6QI72_MAIZE|nr:hypothetical protein ZEAMMB73_Zm00001d052635 [Zea mays]